MSIYDRLKKAFAVSCPIVTLATSDPAQSLRSVVATLDKCQILNWDCAAAFRVPQQPNRDAAVRALADVTSAPQNELSLTEALIKLASAPAGTVAVIQNAHRFLEREDVMQAIWNLRDPFKSPRRMLILMGSSVRLPVELQHDVIELDEPLPSADELSAVISQVTRGAKIDVDPERLAASAAASQGLSAFAAEQLTALNLSKAEGLSTAGVWSDKCKKIDETPGLQVVSTGSFDQVAGCDSVKRFLGGVLGGREKPNAIVFVDEIEKALGGSGSDTSGVSQDQLGVLLSYMQDHRASGCIFVGPPGAAKSAVAKAAGGSGGIPTIQLDLGGMKGSLVGESETRIRDALKVVTSVSGGQTLWLATCNSLTSLPPELRRRFKYGTWYFGLPGLEEREAIWGLYCKKYGHPNPPADLLAEAWTGAEIESCCEIAWKINVPLTEARDYIVPVSRSAAPQIAALEEGASGRFLDAHRGGVYDKSGFAEAELSRLID